MNVSHFNGEISFCNRRNSDKIEWPRMGTDEMEMENISQLSAGLDTDTKLK